ncbi:MAG: hypothetical protein ABF990_12310 [Acetobacter sp.]|uniref:hypothetical protein n=1 Tax=Acetobacter sp. TaxID=440 RepID=UPI0039ED760E
MMKSSKMSFFRNGALGVLGAVSLLAVASAQTVAPVGANGQPPSLTPEQQATMQRDANTALHYKLAPNVLPRLTSALKAIQAAGIQPPSQFGMSLDQQIGLVEQVKGLDGILKANGFTARDFVMSLTCVGLTASLMNVPPNQAGSSPLVPDAANTALLKNNNAQLQALAEVLRGGQSGGGQQQ